MYGHDFRTAPNSGWRGSAEYNDVLAGARYLQGLPTVDPHRIGLWGGSYGGLLTALGLARNSDIFAAGVDYHGVHDWEVLLPDEHDDTASAPDLKGGELKSLRGPPPRMLLSVNGSLRFCSFREMMTGTSRLAKLSTLVQRLRENRVPFDQIVYPNEIHGFLLWKDWIRSYKATAQFFQQHLATH